ncbi:integrase arm-type DNA-binding domain-containing protein [Acidobacteria bacterium AH-259-G07]|nr:integrase arm-type DNA-binding domain-containing protein [Acidobacteria bacterium AH-259-G07]
MKKQSLTAKQVQYMKPDPERRLEVPAGPPDGLYMVVQPSGTKSWAFRYRWKGRPKKLTLGKRYPDLSLAAARAEAEAALAQLRQGIDPTMAKAEEGQAEPDTFSQVVREFVERYAKRNKTWSETERILNHEAVSKWKKRPIQEINRADILRLLDGIMDRGADVMANRTHAALGKLFNWAVERGIIESSPMAGIRPPGKEKSRDRVLSPDELAEVWRATKGLGFPLCPFFRLLILTAQRRSEVANMNWEDVNLEADLWTLPSTATKAGRVHDVPLSLAALEILESLPRFAGPYIFTTTGGEKPINGFSKAKARMDAEILRRRQEATEKAGLEPSQVKGIGNWTIHDIRRTAATDMAKAGVPPHVLAALLNHTPGRTMGISAIYIRHRYAEERRQALETWAEYVISLTKAKENVTTFFSGT